MNLYNIIVIILISHIAYKNININLLDITMIIIIAIFILKKYLKHRGRCGIIQKNIHNQFESDRLLNKKIYEYNTKLL